MPRIGKKGGVSEKQALRMGIYELSGGYKFAQCLKFGPERLKMQCRPGLKKSWQ
jgi:hypothetical protein